MVSSLSSQNVIQYLQEAGLSSSEDGASADAELPGSSNNFNLLVTLAGDRRLLVKQEHRVEKIQTAHELYNEWLFHELLRRFPLLGNISAIASLAVHFDEENAILVRHYLKEYQDLGSFYTANNSFPLAIPNTIGNALADLHRTTYNRREYRDFMATAPQGEIRFRLYNPTQGIDSLSSEIFGAVPSEALKFYILYQRYESLDSAIADLASSWKPSCLTHNDVKLENILLHEDSRQSERFRVRLIDWEACAWGDPSYDLGTLVASYLKLWLESLVVDPTIGLEESLRLAVTPLEDIQPSLLALIRSYLNTFPMILEYRPDFVTRVVQFAGLGLIHQIEEKIRYRKNFDHRGICMLQVAKSLLKRPQQSVSTVFGVSEASIIKPFTKSTKKSQTENDQKLVRLFDYKTSQRG